MLLRIFFGGYATTDLIWREEKKDTDKVEDAVALQGEGARRNRLTSSGLPMEAWYSALRMSWIAASCSCPGAQRTIHRPGSLTRDEAEEQRETEAANRAHAALFRKPPPYLTVGMLRCWRYMGAAASPATAPTSLSSIESMLRKAVDSEHLLGLKRS